MRTPRESAKEALFEELQRTGGMGRAAYNALCSDPGETGKAMRLAIDQFERVILADRFDDSTALYVLPAKPEDG